MSSCFLHINVMCLKHIWCMNNLKLFYYIYICAASSKQEIIVQALNCTAALRKDQDRRPWRLAADSLVCEGKGRDETREFNLFLEAVGFWSYGENMAVGCAGEHVAGVCVEWYPGWDARRSKLWRFRVHRTCFVLGLWLSGWIRQGPR